MGEGSAVLAIPQRGVIAGESIFLRFLDAACGTTMVNEEGREAECSTTVEAFFAMLIPFAEGLVADWRLNVGLNLTL